MFIKPVNKLFRIHLCLLVIVVIVTSACTTLTELTDKAEKEIESAKATVAEKAEKELKKAKAAVEENIDKGRKVAEDALKEGAKEGLETANEKLEEGLEDAEDVIEDGVNEGLETIGGLSKETAENMVTTALESVPISKSFDVPIPISDRVINQIIQVKQEANKLVFRQQLVENWKLSFTNGHIVVTGDVIETVLNQLEVAMNNQLVVVMHPQVINGEVRFNVVNATIGDNSIPERGVDVLNDAQTVVTNSVGELIKAVHSELENELLTASSLPTVQLKDIPIKDGTMTIVIGVDLT